MSVLFFYAGSLAQPQFNYPPHYVDFLSEVSFRTWTIKESGQTRTISQTAFPLSSASPLMDNLSLFFSTLHSNALLKSSSSEDALSGLADGKFKLFYQPIPHRVLLDIGCSVPYGRNLMTAKEMDVAEIIFENVLGFEASRFGEGFDVDLGCATAFQAGHYLTFGAGLGYLMKGEYEFLKFSEMTFQPGNELSLNMGIDLKTDSVFLRTDFLFKTYARDKLNAENFFKQGDQFELSGLFVVQSHPFKFNLSVKNIIKRSNRLSGEIDYYPLEGKNFIDNSLYSKAILFYNFNRTLSIFGNFGFNKFGDSDLQMGNAWVVSSGLGMGKKFSQRFMTKVEVSYLNGTASQGDITLRGWAGKLSLHFRY